MLCSKPARTAANVGGPSNKAQYEAERRINILGLEAITEIVFHQLPDEGTIGASVNFVDNYLRTVDGFEHDSPSAGALEKIMPNEKINFGTVDWKI